MCRSVAGLLSLAVLALCVTSISCIEDCPCKDVSLCRPLTAKIRYPVELVVFHGGGTEWKRYDWSKITTVITSGIFDHKLLCHAHAHKARVIAEGAIGLGELFDINVRTAWASAKLHSVQERYLDGINLRFASALKAEVSAKVPGLIEEITAMFKKKIPGSQVSMNVPWMCNHSSALCSDIISAAKFVDHMYVISFDVQRHTWMDCFAKANAPYHQTLTGITSYIKKGVNSQKMILVVPWFGLDYTCIRFIEAGRCVLRSMPLEEATCSNIRASRIRYKDVMKLLPKSITGRIWDDDQKAPFFVYKIGQVFHEVWYDDPESISLRSTFLKKFKLGGIGMLNAEFASYERDPVATMQTEEMWNALCPP
ncbi:di-N-acetylchitobiase-like [Rhinoraja longicauda]